jgi:hemerythrin-like domain-containing protein
MVHDEYDATLAPAGIGSGGYVAKKKTTGRKTARGRAAGRKSTRTAARRRAPAKRATAKKRLAPQKKTARRKTAGRAAATRKAPKKPASKPQSRLQTAATAVRGAVAGAVSAVTERMPWASGQDDALSLLETDHRRFEQLLKQGEETTEAAVKGRTELLKTITTELNLHELIEEKVLYPALKLHREAKDIVLESFQEHHVADVIVRELQGTNVTDEKWGAKFKVLKENIEHHIQEEEGEMWRTARAVFTQEELRQLGARMARMKAEAQRGS